MLRLPGTYKTDSAAHKPLLDLLDGVLLTPAELAKHWRLTESHLSNLRLAGKGLPYIKLGAGSDAPHNERGRASRGAVRYRLSEVVGHELASTRGGVTLDRIALALAAMPGLSAADRDKIVSHLREAFKT